MNWKVEETSIDENDKHGHYVDYWLYDGVKTDNIAIISDYHKGKRHGWTIKFYSSGKIMRKTKYYMDDLIYDENRYSNCSYKNYYIK